MEANGATSTGTSRWRADCLQRRACSNWHAILCSLVAGHYEFHSDAVPAAWFADLAGAVSRLFGILVGRQSERPADFQFVLALSLELNLRRELSAYQERFPKLKDDELFAPRFLRAFVTEDEGKAADALCGGPKAKNVDAVFIDNQAKVVFIVQGKYRHHVATKGR